MVLDDFPRQYCVNCMMGEVFNINWKCRTEIVGVELLIPEEGLTIHGRSVQKNQVRAVFYPLTT